MAQKEALQSPDGRCALCHTARLTPSNHDPLGRPLLGSQRRFNPRSTVDRLIPLRGMLLSARRGCSDASWFSWQGAPLLSLGSVAASLRPPTLLPRTHWPNHLAGRVAADSASVAVPIRSGSDGCPQARAAAAHSPPPNQARSASPALVPSTQKSRTPPAACLFCLQDLNPDPARRSAGPLCSALSRKRLALFRSNDHLLAAAALLARPLLLPALSFDTHSE